MLFAYGSGSSRFSQRNQYVAGMLQQAGIATLLFDLLTEAEADDRRKVFDIELLAERLQEAADWLTTRPDSRELNVGHFGASTGAAAALVAAARGPEQVGAVVSRGGRPDLACDDLADVTAATLLIVGGDDEPVLEMNREALALMNCERELVVIPGATHLFPEPGALEEAARVAREWFSKHLSGAESQARARATADPDPPDDGFFDVFFRDREDAGKQLAVRLKDLELREPLVLGIPRGGIVIGAVLARELAADLDVVLSRKLRAPTQPELAVGAVGEDGSIYLTEESREIPGVTDEYLATERDHQLKEIRRRQELFRPVRPQAPLEGRSVILTGDGIATGSTMMAALDVVKSHNPHEMIVAVPVAAPSRLTPIRERADRVICLHAPDIFWAIGQFYADFTPVEDRQVVDILLEFVRAVASN